MSVPISSPSLVAEPLGDDDLVLGVDIGGTTVKAEISAAAGPALVAESVPTPRGEAALDAAADLGARLLDRL
ncbi:hypothetical protein GL305_10930, partial [Nocardia seriolae]|nr:hypothetical protein [Nocardia seriolae]